MGIIYKHTNKINGKSYIGQTVQTMEIRLKQHLKEKRNFAFISAIKKYGVENFTSEVIESNVENLDEREKYWIKYYDTYNNGYNMTEGGDGFTSEQKKKWIAENYDKHIENMRKNGLFDTKGKNNPFFGKHHTEETKNKSVNNRKANNGGEYHPNGNRTAKTFKFISPTGEEFIVFNSAKKFCEKHRINVKLFQKYPNQIIQKSNYWNSRISEITLNSIGWKREEV